MDTQIMTSYSRIFSLLIVAIGLLCMGCDPMSDSSEEKSLPPPENVYKGLSGQKCAVMVWTDQRTRLDFPNLQLELGKMMVAHLDVLTAVKESNKDAKDKDPNAPPPPSAFILPASVVRYQREHPEVYFQPIAETAPKLGVTRLIYIEIKEFSTQSPTTIMLLKGKAIATLTVLEIFNGQVFVALQERDIAVTYPSTEKAPEGIVPTDQMNNVTIYSKTLVTLAGELARRFAPAEK